MTVPRTVSGSCFDVFLFKRRKLENDNSCHKKRRFRSLNKSEKKYVQISQVREFCRHEMKVKKTCPQVYPEVIFLANEW